MNKTLIAAVLIISSAGAFACDKTLPYGSTDKCYTEAPAKVAPKCPYGTIVKVSGEEICRPKDVPNWEADGIIKIPSIMFQTPATGPVKVGDKTTAKR